MLVLKVSVCIRNSRILIVSAVDGALSGMGFLLIDLMNVFVKALALMVGNVVHVLVEESFMRLTAVI